MKITKQGNVPTLCTTATFRCSYCGCEWEAEYAECSVKFDNTSNAEGEYHYNCPCCKRDTERTRLYATDIAM